MENIKPLLLIFDNNGETLDRYTIILIDQAAMTAKTVDYISACDTGRGVYLHGHGLKMTHLKEIGTFSMENNAVKCEFLLDKDFKCWLGVFCSFNKLDANLKNMLYREFADLEDGFNFEYPFIDFDLPFGNENQMALF